MTMTTDSRITSDMFAPPTRAQAYFRPTRRMVEIALTVILGVTGFLLVSGSATAQNTINSQIRSEGLFFPVAGSPNFSPALFPSVQQYAGMAVDTGPLAAAYANGYITPSVAFLTGGKTPAEISALASANPTNVALQAENAQVFQATTVKGLLLASWTTSRLANYGFWAGIAALVGCALLLLISLIDLMGAAGSTMTPHVSRRHKVRPVVATIGAR